MCDNLLGKGADLFNMTYAEKLKDPRWQKKRLEILQRDNFTCLMCKSNEHTLHVHHGYYESYKHPWDYDSKTLHTLCCDCHESLESHKRDINFEMALISPKNLSGLMEVIMEFKNKING